VVARRATGVYAVALLLLLTVFTACGGSSSPDPSPTDQPSEAATPATTLRSPTPSPTPTDTFAGAAPDRDLIDLAVRYRGLAPDAPRLARTAPFDYEIGDADEFRVFDLAGEPSVATVTATLRHVTEHAYFFVEEGTPVAAATLQTIGSDFESLVYPAVTEAFGHEWSPGVDSDARMTILHVDLDGAGGYFAGSNEFPAAVATNSNEREMITLDAGMLNTPGVAYNALAAHELQHMVHWNADVGEDSWVNEGLSQVAADLAGGGSGLLSLYLASPDVGLVDWPEIGQSAVHYAASQLFFGYLLDQYGGRENVAALVSEPLDGIAGVQRYLDGFDADYDGVFADWLAATYLNEESGTYAHLGVSTAAINRQSIASGDGEGSVSQFGADFLEIDSTAGATFTFDGAETVAGPAPNASGAYYWSNEGDGIDSRMTREFDLSDANSATLRFDAWHEIERGWDYAYVAASVDDGATWRALSGSQASDYDPVGQSYGPGYTGSSGGWVEEEVDLSQFAGDSVLIRFEYVTDGSTNLGGFAVDNIEVAELGCLDDGDNSGNWASAGFRRITGPDEQKWLVQLVDRDTGVVQRIDVDAANKATITLPKLSAIIVSAVSEGTPEKAEYTWSLPSTID
jgi:hypothetical protein